MRNYNYFSLKKNAGNPVRKRYFIFSLLLFFLAINTVFSQNNSDSLALIKNDFNRNILYIEFNKIFYFSENEQFFDNNEFTLNYKTSFRLHKKTLINFGLGIGNFRLDNKSNFICPARVSVSLKRFDFGVYAFYSGDFITKKYLIFPEIKYQIIRYLFKSTNNFLYTDINIIMPSIPSIPFIGISLVYSFKSKNKSNEKYI